MKSVDVVIYDLNQTLYRKSSKDEFFKFVCFKKGYKILNLAQLAFIKVVGKLRLMDITNFKENFFRYLDDLEPQTVAKYAKQFWSVEYPDHFNEKFLNDLRQHQDKGRKVIIITGGLEIYTQPLREFLHVEAIIGTRSEYKNKRHVVIGKACKDEEKLRRLAEYMDSTAYTIVEAYSDEEEAMLEAAESGYLVNNGKIANADE